jgi:hypothetical protein
MKILITENLSSTIEGYNVLPVVQGNLKIVDIPRNACESIIIDNCMDHLKQEDILESLAGKLRKEGVINVIGTDIYVLSQKLINKDISIDEFCSYASNTKKMWSMEKIISVLKNFNMTIVTATLQGLRYDIRAQRNK